MPESIGSRRARGSWLGSAVVLVLLAVAAVVWWQRRIEAGADPANLPAASFDDYVYYYPTARYAFGELRAGRMPFWNPYQHVGSPFLATPEHGLLYPPNVLYLLLPTPTAEKASALLHLVLAAFGAACLGRIWRQSWLAAATTGVAFAFAPPVTALVYLPQHLDGVAWMPWQLVLLHRLLASRSPAPWAVLLGVSSALQYLGGYPMYCLMSAYLLLAYFCWWQWGAWRAGAGRRSLIVAATSVAAAGLLALSLSAPQLLPRLELAEQSPRGLSALSLEQAALNSVPPSASFLRAVLPMRDAEGLLPNAYLGAPLLLLALVGVASSWRTTGAGFFLGVTIVSWLLACGTDTPLFRLYYLLPGGGAFRVPFRFFPVTSLGIAFLGGTGVDALWRGRVHGRALGLLSAASLVGGVMLVLVGRFAPVPDRIMPATGRPPSFPLFMTSTEQLPALVTALGLYLLASAAWLAYYVSSTARLRRALVATLPLVVYATFFVATRNTRPLPVTHPDLHTMPERVVAFLREAQGVDRTYVVPTLWPVGPAGRELPAKAGELHGLYALNGRENVYPKRFAELVALLLPPGAAHDRDALLARLGLPPYIPQGEVVARADSPNLRLLDLLGARFVVEGPGASFKSERAPDRFTPVFEDDGIRVLRNADAYPRAFLVHRAEVVDDLSRALERLVSPDFDPRTTALLERAPPLQLSGPAAEPSGSGRIVRYTPDEVTIDVEAPAPGILVLTDQYYPGWQADVDGTPTDVLVTDYVLRGVPVPAGTHRVVFRFVPRAFRRGLVIAVLGSALALAVLVVVRRRVGFAARDGVR